ncbi:MAG: hemerythrin domain-containing protein [Candidatus Hydrogenedentes bacterium]|nr:hemerythrin domain-containing protein [Candidatus Hydrogenedentota bacterium]
MKRYMIALTFGIVSVSGALSGQAPSPAPAEAAAVPVVPGQTLRDEHAVIEEVLGLATQEAKHLRKTKQLERGRVAMMAAFFKGFADQCHHAKEEHYLFPALEAAGDEATHKLIMQLMVQHEEGRAHIRAIIAAVKAWGVNEEIAAKDAALHLDGYVKLLRNHIKKENKELLPRVARLPDEAQQALAAAFDKVEREEMGGGTHAQFEQMVEELKASPPKK